MLGLELELCANCVRYGIKELEFMGLGDLDPLELRLSSGKGYRKSANKAFYFYSVKPHEIFFSDLFS